jgi:membrane fusion protein (multidrug efflux system)
MTRARKSTARLRALLLASLAGCGGAGAEKHPPAAQAAERKADERGAPSVEHAEARRVEVAVIHASEARLSTTIPGEVEGGRDATLASALGGPIERLLVREGDRVKPNQVVAHIDTALYRIQKKQAETKLALAQRQFERGEGLGSALPAAERERRQSEMDLLRSGLDLATLQLKRSTIRAPFAGVVASLDVEVGEVVPPAAPLLRLVSLDPVLVVLSVPDRDVVALTVGSEVEVRFAAQSGARKGKITRISPTGDQETRAFRAEVEMANEDMSIMPGMIASVRVARTLDEGAVVVPQDWLVTKRDGVGVFVEADGRVRYQPVKAGRIVREQVVIDEGITKGARVVTKGHRELADGDRVVVVREGRCCNDGRVQFE